ncbi:hypothetical protein Hanom_Chr11g01042501 [Helianthus anomalus]
MQRHMYSNGSADGYHARMAAHAPDITRLLPFRYSAVIALGSANVLSFQHMTGKSHQLPPTRTCGLQNLQKATNEDNSHVRGMRFFMVSQTIT